MKQFTPYAFLIAFLVVLSSCAKVSIKDGMKAYEELRYQDAITHLENGLSKTDDPDARRALADAYLATNQYSQAKEEYAILASAPGNSDQDRINYGRALMANGEYDQAEEIFEGILSRDPSNVIAQNLRSSCNNIAGMKADSARYAVEPVIIGGLDAVYSPTAMNNRIYFSAEKAGMGDVDQYTGLKFTDLYEASLDGTTIGTPEKVANVNGKFHDGIATVSQDGKTMILTRSNYERKNRLSKNDDGINTTQLYITKKQEDGTWSDPDLMPFCDGMHMYAHPALSSDGKTLYFSANLAEGYGGMDLYMSKLENDVWSKPANLGNNVNTPGNEVFPALRSDDSLYYSSNAVQTIGGLDLVYAVKAGNAWNGPYHLPYPMNSVGDDFGMTFTGDKSTGFFSSDRSNGRDQLYTFKESEINFVLKGLVTNKNNGDPIESSKVIVTNITDGSVTELQSDDVGMFEMELIPGKDYRVRAEKDGFFAVNEEVSTKNLPNGGDINVNLALMDLSNPEGPKVDTNGEGYPKGINPNNPYEIPEIYWDYDKWDIREASKPYLNYVADLLKDNEGLKVEVSSHADSRGSIPYNDELSEKRANAVAEYLVSKGVRRSMLISRGYGERRLVNGCSDGAECSEEQHEENRRTEFTVIE